MTILVIADHDNQKLNPTTLLSVSAAHQIGGDVHILVAGWQTDAVVQSAAQIAGVAKVLQADNACLEHALSENLAAQVLSVAAQYSHILFSANAVGKSTAPRVAAKLDVAQISEIIKVISPGTFERAIFAGNAIATIQSSDAIKVLTVRTTAFHAAPATGGCSGAAIEKIAPVQDSGQSQFIRHELVNSERPELTCARVVVAGGRALGSKENFDALLLPLADKLNGAVGATRAAIDAGYAPNDWQIGQTGKVIAPELYIAVGISGAFQHTAGVKDSRVIVAINKDPEAPIFAAADYGLVADLFEVLPQIKDLL